jgi:hypothetical protein
VPAVFEDYPHCLLIIMKLFKSLVISQSTYIFITGAWPIIDIKSFMMVTGPKTDIWLVKTVGALLIPVALTMISFLRCKNDRYPAMILGAGIAISFICVDTYYALTDVISNIYLADAAAESIFLVGWIASLLQKKNLAH